MDVELKIIGNRLCRSVVENLSELNEIFEKLCRYINPIVVHATELGERRNIPDMLLQNDKPSIVLIEVNNIAAIDALQAAEKKELMLLRSETGAAVRLSPVIAVFESQKVINDIRDMPELIADWIYEPLNYSELVRRIFAVLKRKNLLKAKLHYGALTLLPEMRTIFFFGKSMHLTRSEFALAELFLSQMGSVIPFSDLVLLFRSTGKSTEGSNIRVTIFQLRLKLEMLTKGQYTLVSVYKQGYCLKQKTRSTLKEVSDSFEERLGREGRYALR
jgi:DNA-binding response OmpR family regulator